MIFIYLDLIFIEKFQKISLNQRILVQQSLLYVLHLFRPYFLLNFIILSRLKCKLSIGFQIEIYLFSAL